MWATPEPSQATVAELIAEGQSALLAGERIRARALLQMAIHDDPENTEAWLWMSGTHSAPEDIAYCLQQVLRLEPDNVQALDGIVWLQETHGLVLDTPGAPTTFPAPPQEAQPERRSKASSPKERAAPPVPQTAPRSAASRMVEAATTPATALGAGMHLVAIGVLIGLFRLVILLRPTSLLLARSIHGPLTPPAALALTVASAALHSIALVPAWLLLRQSVLRADQSVDPLSISKKLSRALLPGYGVALALPIAALTLGWSDRRWTSAAITIAVVLLMSGGFCIWRLYSFLKELRIANAAQRGTALRVMMPLLAVAAVTLFLAATAVRLLFTIL